MGGLPLTKGDVVPDFSLPAATREARDGRFTLSEAAADGPLVIAFYPLAFTGVCTREVCDLRDAFHDLARLQGHVVGFSTDTPAANHAFARAHDLPFPLVSDPNREVVEQVWATQTVVGVHRCAMRGVLVVDRDRRVAWSWVTDDADEWVGLDAVVEVLATLRGSRSH